MGEQNLNHFCPCSVCVVNVLPEKAFSSEKIVLSFSYSYGDVGSISKAMCTHTHYPKILGFLVSASHPPYFSKERQAVVSDVD